MTRVLELVQQIISKLGFDETNNTLDIDTEHLRVRDSIVEINSQFSGSDDPILSPNELGIIIYDDSGIPVKLIYDKTEECFKCFENGSYKYIGISSNHKDILNILETSPKEVFDDDLVNRQLFDTLSHMDI